MGAELQAYEITKAPYYLPIGNEIQLYEAAYARRLPVLLKGPTGCGKTRFIEFMAHRLGVPLITLACNEDMTASDLVGRFLLDELGTVWHDGPLTEAVRYGGICYLDEVVEARQDTTVIIHPLTDSRRILPLDKKGEQLIAHPDFQLVVSYNPGYQSHSKDMKPSTRQRFVALEFNYPRADAEALIVATEASTDLQLCRRLVDIAERSRALKSHGLGEGASTRALIYAAQLIEDGVTPLESCDMALIHPLSDDPDMIAALRAVVHAYF